MPPGLWILANQPLAGAGHHPWVLFFPARRVPHIIWIVHATPLPASVHQSRREWKYIQGSGYVVISGGYSRCFISRFTAEGLGTWNRATKIERKRESVCVYVRKSGKGVNRVLLVWTLKAFKEIGGQSWSMFDPVPTQPLPLRLIVWSNTRLHDLRATSKNSLGKDDHLRYAGLVILCILFLSPTLCIGMH